MFGLPPKERQNPPVGAGGASAEFGESPRHLEESTKSPERRPGRAIQWGPARAESTCARLSTTLSSLPLYSLPLLVR